MATRVRILLLCWLLLAVGAACGTPAPPPAPPPDPQSNARFRELADRFLAAYYGFHPGQAVTDGLHRYDGRVPDRSAAAIRAYLGELATVESALRALPARRLARTPRLEREVVLARIAEERFELEVLRSPWRNPLYYGEIEVTYYATQPYAPLAERARAVISVARGTRAYLQQARENLEPALPQPWLETALLQTRGLVSFLEEDVPLAFRGLRDRALRRELGAALPDAANALRGFASWLDARRLASTEDFALGEEVFLRMLEATVGLRSDLATLQRIAQQDLERNQRALAGAAAQIDPRATVDAVVRRVYARKVPARLVIATAERQARETRRFLARRRLVSVPPRGRAEVRETPPFLRYNFAFLDPAGVFEREPLPSFYYITPPDPSWPPAEQRAYLPPEEDLLYTTVHELWPGHFLQSLHLEQNPSAILKSLCSYATTEGWAHYAEELMHEAGLREGDSAAHIAQLVNALLRDARMISAIGLHTQGMSVATSRRLFEREAYQDPRNARQQAVRGTFDPMYLVYTVGKLAIYKLRADWNAQESSGFTLQGFHDRFLAHGCAPLATIRASMLGPQAGPLL